uniref:Protein translocase subunit SecA n=1 Tax=Pseudellipsoidion edaphicum TaxID=1431838 RepID=A0A410D2R5_9STRA|nr:preprotein-translocase subunit a [Pseudellipsoidion edaphicum]QAA12031.1 preprotein-translocase subunit a [Pseudellipsoidion edaphicum]
MKLPIDLNSIFRPVQISSFYFEILDQINSLESQTTNLSDSEIRDKVKRLKKAFLNSKSNTPLIAESFSLTREMASRKLGLRHFDTQLLGGLILNDGKIAEMKTGEGKTLVATLPACFQALSGNGVHIVTVNEYLAKRDKELLQIIYQSLGFKVGLIRENMETIERQFNYACDITYTTNTELGFDYLRDLMTDSLKNRVLRSFNYCLIDEVDSVLIDEAQTPLILSTPRPFNSDKYPKALWVAKQLVPNRHFIPKYRTKQASLTENGYNFLAEVFQTDDLYDPKNPWLAFVENSLRALLFYHRDQDYIIQNGQVQIIDKFTGRIAKDRKWSDGLHQAIECKENVKISSESQTLNSITYPKFFSLYRKLSGMTGTAKTSEQEFKEFYGLEVMIIPTRKPIKRKDFPDKIYETKKAKFKALIETIQMANQLSRPVLVGTTTIEDSEIITEMLKDLGIENCQLLNAKPENSESEAETIAQSGALDSLTIATNMAGRGTDIILGGNLKYIVNDLVKQIIYQIVNSSPIDIHFSLNFGKISFVLSDLQKLLIDFPPELIQSYLQDVNDIESYTPQTALDIRIRDLYILLLKECSKEWEKGKQLTCDLGGLLILGTSRHESRRIDNQLRGRAGRQGDPGESRFFLSLEDDLVKRYDPNLFLPFMGRDNLEAFSGTDLIAITTTFDSLQLRVEKFLYENRKSSAAFDDIYEYYQKLYFIFRECLLEYKNPLNILTNLASFSLLYPYDSKPNLSFYSLGIKKYSLNKKKVSSFIYLAALLSSSSIITYNQYVTVHFLEICKKLILEMMDEKWMEFGERIALSRDTIGLQAYAQRDPLIQYGRLCSKEFYDLITEIQSLIVNSLINSIEINKIYLGI